MEMTLQSPNRHGKPTLETKDLWQSAFLLSQGTNLLDVVLKKRGFKKEVMFVFEGEKVNQYLQQFKRGQAVCNVINLKASMRHLREEMFKVIND